ncbi:MAG: protein kinase domain-containing protein [Isosphaeraceae bacterium]
MNIVLRVISGPHEGQEYQINRSGSFIVGRASRAAFPMTADLTLSREHFQLENFPPLCHLVDLGSTNGTKVNGLRVERVLLREGDLVVAGDSSFAVHYTGGGGDARLRDTCAGCGVQLANGVPFTSTKPEEVTSVLTAPRSLISSLLCADCEARRQQFPETSPDYLIEEVIGEGGMGTVYRARQISRNRRVAIKMMIANSTAGEKALNYFHREIHALRDMLMPGGKCHPSIVEFYELFQIEGHFQLVMEYVDGKNALDWVRALKQPMPIATAARIGQDLLSALHFAHTKGYVHRDIKPSNLLVMGPVHRPRVKLSDFGLAKSMVDNSSVFSNLTRQGDIGGSVGFLSPEHIRQFGEVREPADIYCAGATLFYLLTEKYPYLGFDPGRPDSYEMILDHPPVPLRAYRPDAPEGLEQILLKALRKRPHSRWKSAESMWRALRAFLAPSPD